jgi:hypothetical protein
LSPLPGPLFLLGLNILFSTLNLFNIALEKAVRDAGIEKRGTIYHKSVQVLASADDIDIIGRTTRAVKETFLKLEKAAQEIVLTVNESKTKYI